MLSTSSTFKRQACAKSKIIKWWNFETKKVPQHPRDRLTWKVKELNEAVNEILITNIILAKKPLQPWERKNLKDQKIATANSDALVSNFLFNSVEIFDKSLIFDLKKMSGKKILYMLIEKPPEHNDKYYVEQRESTNSFRIRQDKAKKIKNIFLKVHS